LGEAPFFLEIVNDPPHPNKSGVWAALRPIIIFLYLLLKETHYDARIILDNCHYMHTHHYTYSHVD